MNTRADLTVVTQRFIGEKGQVGLKTRADCRAWHRPPCLQVVEPVHLGTTRTDYVSTQEGTEWYEGAVDPRMGSGYWHARRAGDFFAVNAPEASSGDEGVTGHMEAGNTVATRLFQNGTLLQLDYTIAADPPWRRLDRRAGQPPARCRVPLAAATAADDAGNGIDQEVIRAASIR